MLRSLTAFAATRDLKNRPIFTDLKLQACKTFINLATGSIFQATKSINLTKAAFIYSASADQAPVHPFSSGSAGPETGSGLRVGLAFELPREVFRKLGARSGKDDPEGPEDQVPPTRKPVPALPGLRPRRERRRGRILRVSGREVRPQRQEVGRLLVLGVSS